MFDSDFGTRKLAHYNKWLLDPKRPSGQIYPGFPEELARQKQAEKAQAKAAVSTKSAKAVAVKPKAKRAKRASDGSVTKQELAVQIFRELDGNKVAVISAIQERLDMSLAGATTYFYNAKKLA